MSSRRPNILFCLADDAGMHFGAYDCRWVNTPGFDRVAREGLLFSRAFTPNAKCAPSRACILTGRNSWQLEEGANHQTHFPARFTTCFEALHEHGYFVGHTAKGWAPGDPGTVGGEPRQLTGPAYNERKCTPPPTINNCDYAANFADFLDDRPEDQPFCFWFGCTEPHRPYEYGSGAERGGKNTADIDEVYEIWPDNEVVRTDLLDYGFQIEHFDRHLCAMLDELERRDELDNTLVVVTSDNGMPFPRAKGQEYYYSNHLPLAVMWRDRIVNPGRTVREFVSFIDFTPTFLDAAGIGNEDSGMQPITGQSLMDIINDRPGKQTDKDRDHVLIGKERHDLGRPDDVGYPIRGIFQDDYLYLINFEPDRWPAGNPETGYMNCDGSPTKTEILKARQNPETRRYWEWSFGKRPEEELYCIADDPACIRNLAGSAGYDELRRDMRQRLTRELRAQNDPRIQGNGEIFDSYPTASVRLKSFYSRFMDGELEAPGWINESDVEEIHKHDSDK
ncbi:MAG: sulfatase [Planctomycetota bacterium]